ncbi:MAG: transposase [Nitrospinota bacterium]|nr:MAG: transposase [Nitrospinota bacterium]
MTSYCYFSSTRHRRSIRLSGYDYTQPGAYFVTICTQKHRHLFGEVVDGKVRLSTSGSIVHEEWFRTARLRPSVVLYADEFVVMPNHIHGIIWIRDQVGAQRRCAPTPHLVPGSLGVIVRAFKSAVTRRINVLRYTRGVSVWQRNYWEHVIRTERTLEVVRRYIVENPLRWHLDRYNENATGSDPLARDLWRVMQEDVHCEGNLASPSQE